MIFPIIGNGACFDNSAAAHIYEDPIQGLNLKRVRQSFIVQNWSYFGLFFPIPFIERVGTGNESYMICCETYEDLAKFLLNEESLFLFSNSSIDIVALATMFHIDVHIFTYNRVTTNGDSLPERWTTVYPDRLLQPYSPIPPGEISPLYLYHADNSHYDLLVNPSSRLAVQGTVSSRIEKILNPMNFEEHNTSLPEVYSPLPTIVNKITSN